MKNCVDDIKMFLEKIKVLKFLRKYFNLLLWKFWV